MSSHTHSGTGPAPGGEADPRPGADAGADAVARAEELWNRARGVLAAGLWTISQGAFHYPEGVFPVMAERGDGCRTWDTAGREYVDWMMGWGPCVLGFRHPAVERAIAAELERGTLLSLLTPLEVEVAEAVRDAVPGAEGVAFGKNGSDVLALAVRIARAHTGREVVLTCGYHGFHDWYMAGIPECRGIPAALRETTRPFPYGDLDALAARFAEHEGQVAAVVMEPTSTQLPPPGYLAGVKQLCREHGAGLIFDEIITGFRLARGGAQEAFGVTADLVCLGKGLANGMPLSALVGSADNLQALPGVGYGLTYRGERLSLAAARATLEVWRTEPVAEHLARVGTELREHFDAACVRVGVDAQLTGPPARTTLAFAEAGGLSGIGLMTLFVQECLRAGVLTNGNFLPSLAHDERALEETRAAFDAALETVARAVDGGSFDGLLHVEALSSFFGDAGARERAAKGDAEIRTPQRRADRES